MKWLAVFSVLLLACSSTPEPIPTLTPSPSPDLERKWALESWSRQAMDIFYDSVGGYDGEAEPQCYMDSDPIDSQMDLVLFCDAVIGWDFTSSLFMFVATDDSIGFAQHTHFSNGDGTINSLRCVGTMDTDEKCVSEVLPESETIRYHYEIIDMFQRATGRLEFKVFSE